MLKVTLRNFITKIGLVLVQVMEEYKEDWIGESFPQNNFSRKWCAPEINFCCDMKLLTITHKCHNPKDFNNLNVYEKTKEKDKKCLVLFFIQNLLNTIMCKGQWGNKIPTQRSWTSIWNFAMGIFVP